MPLKHSLVQADFEALFTEAGREFEVFAQTPAQLWDEVMVGTAALAKT